MLREIISKANSDGVAIGHFNISTVDALWAIFESAKELELPIIIGVSEGERNFMGVRQASVLVKSIREEYNYPIFINADHTYSYEGVVRAVDIGYDSVIFDGAKLPFEENIKITKKCVEYARKINPNIVVEGEIGYIGGSSKLLDDIPEGVTRESMTTVEQAKEFVKETGIDLLAPSVGNVHGMLKHSKNPSLDIDRIKNIHEAVGIPLVLHGGSGISDEDFKNGIKAGIGIVHINTEIRKAWRDGVEKSLNEDKEQVAPYKILKGAKEEVKVMVTSRLKLFNNK